MAWDLVIRDALIFDGTGARPWRGDVAVSGGRVVATGVDLPVDGAEVVDAAGRWLMPGLLDVHTHYDLEVELAPGLLESVRHGTTTVVMSNCSLGLAYGNLRDTGADPIVDCFARVENIPKPVLSRAADVATWTTPREYLEHLDGLPLGPNVVPMLPHSMLRIRAMGFEAAISRDPTPTELDHMRLMLAEGFDDGYVGFSTDALPFHYLANDPNRRRKIPTQHAGFGELRALTEVARVRDRLWQTTPPKDEPLLSVRNFFLSSGLLYGKPLRVTAVAAMEGVANTSLVRLGRLVSWLLNSDLFRGRFFLQALPARFKVWSDGAITPLAEEVVPLRRLNEPDLEDREARMAILDDPVWQQSFRDWWEDGRTGFTVARLKRLLKLEKDQLTRDLSEMFVDRCPLPSWNGVRLSEPYARWRTFVHTGRGTRDDAELAFFETLPRDRSDEASFLIALLRAWDTDLCWWSITANATEAITEKVLLDEAFLPGFSDSGAHITNMAFYDVNLRALKTAARHGPEVVARMVHRLTRLPASVFGVDAGRLEPGAQADLVLIDPDALAAYDGEANTLRIHRDAFEHEQLVNRSDGVVPAVWIRGRLVWDGAAPTPILGTEPLGRCLRVEAG